MGIFNFAKKQTTTAQNDQQVVQQPSNMVQPIDGNTLNSQPKQLYQIKNPNQIMPQPIQPNLQPQATQIIQQSSPQDLLPVLPETYESMLNSENISNNTPGATQPIMAQQIAAEPVKSLVNHAIITPNSGSLPNSLSEQLLVSDALLQAQPQIEVIPVQFDGNNIKQIPAVVLTESIASAGEVQPTNLASEVEVYPTNLVSAGEVQPTNLTSASELQPANLASEPTNSEIILSTSNIETLVPIPVIKLKRIAILGGENQLKVLSFFQSLQDISITRVNIDNEILLTKDIEQLNIKYKGYIFSPMYSDEKEVSYFTASNYRVNLYSDILSRNRDLILNSDVFIFINKSNATTILFDELSGLKKIYEGADKPVFAMVNSGFNLDPNQMFQSLDQLIPMIAARDIELSLLDGIKVKNVTDLRDANAEAGYFIN